MKRKILGLESRKLEVIFSVCTIRLCEINTFRSEEDHTKSGLPGAGVESPSQANTGGFSPSSKDTDKDTQMLVEEDDDDAL